MAVPRAAGSAATDPHYPEEPPTDESREPDKGVQVLVQLCWRPRRKVTDAGHLRHLAC
jgi:hypothetical protein